MLTTKRTPATISEIPTREFPLVQQAHERNDEVLELIYIGCRFRDGTE